MLYLEALRSEYAKASERLNLFAGFERYLEMAGVPDMPVEGFNSREEAAPPSPEGNGRPSVEAHLRDTQAMLQSMTATMADMARMMHPGTGAPGDPAPTGEDSEDAKGQDGG